jgi:hypothetical protein
LKAKKLDSVSQLNTFELTLEEKSSKTLDFVASFQIFDLEFRMIVVEGLVGAGKGIDKVYQANPRLKNNR